MPLMNALSARKTSRAFLPDALPVQTLSDLLWAAFGVNRPESGKRTAPSAVNWQDTEIYVVMESGVFLYDASSHELDPVRAGDLRALTGTQPFVRDAPVTLVLVSDLSRIAAESQEQKDFYSAIDAGFISQNVYLYCASEGLATGVRALIDRPALKEALGLREDQRIIVAQSVGRPGVEPGSP
jgi:SagB-type dehydrogenase family enzyme